MASRYYTYFLNCWKNRSVTQEQLQNAVTKGLITQAEYETIIATPQNPILATAATAEKTEEA